MPTRLNYSIKVTTISLFAQFIICQGRSAPLISPMMIRCWRCQGLMDLFEFFPLAKFDPLISLSMLMYMLFYVRYRG